MNEVRKPLPAGALIQFGEFHAEVVKDPGGNGLIDVLVDGEPQKWEWCVEGEECTLVTGVGIERAAFPIGTIIVYIDMQAVVVADDGGDQLVVMVEEGGSLQKWWYSYEGHACSVQFQPELTEEQRAQFKSLADEAMAVGLKGSNEPGNRLYSEAYRLLELPLAI
ncbi:hypothetical protein ACYPKM_01595 [Pseudomonas aeruginosa]